MSEKVVALKNGNGEVKSVDVGFSGWVAVFGWFAAATLGSQASAAGLFIVQAILYFIYASTVSNSPFYYAFNPNGLASLQLMFIVVAKIIDCIVASSIGKSIARSFIDKGFKPIDERNREILASCGIETETIEENPPPQQENSSTSHPGTITMEELNDGPKDAHAYISKMVSDFGLTKETDLVTLDSSLRDRKDFQKAMFFAGEDYKKILEGYAESVDEKITSKNREEKYQEASLFQKNSEYEKASELFKQLGIYGDAEQLANECTKLQQEAEQSARTKEKLERAKSTKRTYIVVASLIAVVVVASIIIVNLDPPQQISRMVYHVDDITVTADGVEVRSHPYNNSEVIYMTANGDEGFGIGYQVVDGVKWHQISLYKTRGGIKQGVEGWIRSKWLRIGK